MPGTDSLRKHSVEIAWGLFAAANVAAMIAWPDWETIPFHFVWISLTLLYGFRVWSNRATTLVLGAVALTSGASIFADAFAGIQLWGELFEVPLMSAMFLAMVWHARRRQLAIAEANALAESRASLLGEQERFLHDASHELRTPVTIARGHLELLRRNDPDSPELAVALDELGRMERLTDRLLLLAKVGHPDFVVAREIDVESFVEDVFMRWSEVAPRAWRLGPLARGRIRADEEALRTALDALLENAVKYTQPHEPIELRATGIRDELLLEVADGGCGIAPDVVKHVFERFARADDARTRAAGGAGLGLSIVAAIAKAHGGLCTVTPLEPGTAFRLRLPGFERVLRPAARPAADGAGDAAALPATS
jgi:two-component system OmpR family sensor kinase